MPKTIRSEITLTAQNNTAKGFGDASKNVKKFERDVLKSSRAASQSLNSINKSTDQTIKQFESLSASAGAFGKGLAAFTIGREVVDQVKNLADLTDTVKRLEGQLKALGLTSEEADDKLEELTAIATKNRVSAEETVSSYVRMARALGGTKEAAAQATSVVDALTKAVTLSNVSSETAKAGLVQFAQGFGSVSLAGEELRSVMENLPVLAQVLTDHLGVTRTELKKLGAEGKLGPEVLAEALEQANGRLTALVEAMPVTIGQATEQLKNAFLLAADESTTLTTANNALGASLQFLAQNLQTVIDLGGTLATFLALSQVPKAIAFVERFTAARAKQITVLKAQQIQEQRAATARVAEAKATLAAAQAELTLAKNREVGVLGTKRIISTEKELARVRSAEALLANARASKLSTTVGNIGKASKIASFAGAALSRAYLPLAAVDTLVGFENLFSIIQQGGSSLKDIFEGNPQEAVDNFREGINRLTNDQGETLKVTRLYEGTVQGLAGLFSGGWKEAQDSFTFGWKTAGTVIENTEEKMKRLNDEARKQAAALEVASQAAGRLPSNLIKATAAVDNLRQASKELADAGIANVLENGLPETTFEGLLLDISLDKDAVDKVQSDIDELNKILGKATGQSLLSVAERADEANEIIEQSFDDRVKLQEELEKRLDKQAEKSEAARLKVMKDNLETRKGLLENTIDQRQTVLDTILKREKELAKEILKVEAKTSEARGAIQNAREKIEGATPAADKKQAGDLISTERKFREKLDDIRKTFDEGGNERALKDAKQLATSIGQVAVQVRENIEKAAEDSGLSSQGAEFVLEREFSDILTGLDSIVQEAERKKLDTIELEKQALTEAGNLQKTNIEQLQKQLSSVLTEARKNANLTVSAALDSQSTSAVATQLDNLTKDRTVNITTVMSTVQQKQTGGFIEPVKREEGGFIPRQGALPGFGGGDRVKALLEPGEFIINKDASRDLGESNLNELNNNGKQAILRSTGGPVNDVQKLQTGGFVKTPDAAEIIGIAVSGKDLDIEAKLDLDIKRADRDIDSLRSKLDDTLSGAGDTLSNAIGKAVSDANFGGLTGAKLAFAKGGRAAENIFQFQDRTQPINDAFNEAVGVAGAALRDAQRLGAAEVDKVKLEFAKEAEGLSSEVRGSLSDLAKDLSDDLADISEDVSEDISGVNADLAADILGAQKDLAEDIADNNKDLGDDILGVLKDFNDEAVEIRQGLSETIKDIVNTTKDFAREVDQLERQISGQGRLESVNRRDTLKLITENNLKVKQLIAEGDVAAARQLNEDTLSLVDEVDERVKDQFGRTVLNTRDASQEALSFLDDIRSNNDLIAQEEQQQARSGINIKIAALEEEAKIEIAGLRAANTEANRLLRQESAAAIAEIEAEADLEIAKIHEAADVRRMEARENHTLEVQEIKDRAAIEIAELRATGAERIKIAEEAAQAALVPFKEQLSLAQQIRETYKDINLLFEENVGNTVNTFFGLGRGRTSNATLKDQLQGQFDELTSQLGGGGGGSGGSGGGGGLTGGASGTGSGGSGPVIPRSSSFSKFSGGSPSNRGFTSSGVGGGTGFAKRPKAVSDTEEAALNASLQGNQILDDLAGTFDNISANITADSSTEDVVAAIETSLGNVSDVATDTGQVQVQRAVAKANVQRQDISRIRTREHSSLLTAVRQPVEIPLKELGGFLSGGIASALSRATSSQVQDVTGLSSRAASEAAQLSASEIENRLTLRESELRPVIQGLIDVEKEATDSRRVLSQQFRNNAQGLGFDTVDSSAAAFRSLLSGGQLQKEGGVEQALDTVERFGEISTEQANEIRSGLQREAEGDVQFAKFLAEQSGIDSTLVTTLDDVARLIDEQVKSQASVESSAEARVRALLDGIAPIEEISRVFTDGPLSGLSKPRAQIDAERAESLREREQVVRRVAVDLTVGGVTATGEFEDGEILERLLAELEQSGRLSN